MSEPLAIELFRKFQQGASIEALRATEGIPSERIECRLRVAFGLILRANGLTIADAMQQGPWAAKLGGHDRRLSWVSAWATVSFGTAPMGWSGLGEGF